MVVFPGRSDIGPHSWGLSVVSTSKRWSSIRTKTIRMTMATMMSYEPHQNSQPRERSRLEK